VSDVGIGLIGCGRIGGPVHLRVLRRAPGARLVAVADPSAEAREQARGIAGVPTIADPQELLARSDVDAVVICAPTGLHAGLAIDAAAAGKAVYVEKPLALTVESAQAAADALARSGAPAAVGFNHRFNPQHQRARELLRDGAIGRVWMIQTAFCEPTPPDRMPDWKRRRATGGGALLDLGSHQADLARWLLDDEIEESSARLRSHVSEHDSAELRLELAGGARVDGFFSFRAARCDWLRIIGEHGTLTIDRYSRSLAITSSREDIGAVRHSRWPARPRAWQLRKALRPAWEPSYRTALRAFVAAAGGATVELPTPEDGVRSLHALLAAEAADPELAGVS
jgi:predicted dehydrogenase